MKKEPVFLVLLFCMLLDVPLLAQIGAVTNIILNPNGLGFVVPAVILPNGDTMIYLSLREVQVTAPRRFGNPADYRRYQQYRKYAAIVYPYAQEATKTYRMLENETRLVSNRDRKKRITQLQDQMNYQFKEPLKNMNRVQGYILVKMVEKDLQMSFYDLVKDLKGTLNAQYWHQFSKFYGYDLREGYVRGKDPILDAVLADYKL